MSKSTRLTFTYSPDTVNYGSVDGNDEIILTAYTLNYKVANIHSSLVKQNSEKLTIQQFNVSI